MEDEKLIEEVFKYKFIYDKSDPKHSNKEYNAKALADIAKELNSSADEAKKRWINLRDNFRRQAREHGEKRSGQAFEKKKQWVFFERLSFLLPYIKGRDMSSSIPAPCIGRQPADLTTREDDTVSVASQDEVEMPSPEESLPPSAPSTSMASLVTKKKITPSAKRKAVDDVAAELLKAIKEPEPTDDDEQFFNSCLPMVRQLPLEEKLEFRINVQQLLLQAIRRQRSSQPSAENQYGHFTLPQNPRYYQEYPSDRDYPL